jgi:16S rRNA processing protein RimM
MGRIAAPFGVAGWLRIQTYTASVASLLSYRVWWIGGGTEWREHEVEKAQARGRALLAKLTGCEDREAAARMRGAQVAIPREALPQTAPNEWYWADLIGLRVANIAGEGLGRVVRILQTGSNDVLVVEDGRERLIPFIEDVVREVDLAAGVIRVDWSADY